MAVIIQSDPYQSLMRKIGYSVGLENLLRNVKDLTQLYASERGISYASWLSLVQGKWKRKNATEHFANFYGSINLLRVIGNNVQPLNTLDALSILYRHFGSGDAKFETAARIILTQCILESDGEIFLNSLAARFDPDQLKTLLEELIGYKRSQIAKVFTSRPLQQKIFGIIDIKAQSQKATGESAAKSRFPVRTEPLSASGTRTTPLSGELDNTVVIPEDYLRKVPQTRKGWAKDLLLTEKDELTQAGSGLLAALQEIGLKPSNNAFVFWPYSHDLLALRIDPKVIGAPALTSWSVLCAIAKGTQNVEPEEYRSNGGYGEVLDTLQGFQKLYKEANATLQSLRHQLPLYVAQPALVGFACANGQPIPPLSQVLDAETRKPKRRVNFVNIRGTEGGIS